MNPIALWEIAEGGPVRMDRTNVGLERVLEVWIERDPTLIFDGLRIVGRQITLPNGGRLDLLAISPEGAWVVVEIKAGPLSSGALTQALSYVENIATLESQDLRRLLERNGSSNLQLIDEMFEIEEGSQRDVQIMLVGVGADIGLQRLSTYLSDTYGVPITLVTFDVFSDSDGKKMLLREVAEREGLPQRKRKQYSVAAIEAMAADRGVSALFEEVLNTVEELGLTTRAHPHSVTFRAPFKGNLTLVYVQPVRADVLSIGYHSRNFVNQYPVTEEEVEVTLGQNWTERDTESTRLFLSALRQLYDLIHERQEDY